MNKNSVIQDRFDFAKLIFNLIIRMGLTEFMFDIGYDRIVIDTKFYHELPNHRLDFLNEHNLHWHIDLKTATLVIMIPERLWKL